MILLFLLLIYLGIYFLIRSGYRDFGLLTYILYTIMIFLGSAIVMGVASGVITVAGPHIQFPQVNEQDTHNELVATVIEQILIEALQGRELDIRVEPVPQLTTEQIIRKLERVEPPQEGVCGVCYDNLESGDLLRCSECHKSAHSDCIKEWILSGQEICIYCRNNFTTQKDCG